MVKFEKEKKLSYQINSDSKVCVMCVVTIELIKARQLYLELYTVKQGDSNVEQYIREFEKLMMRSEVP